MVSLGALPRMPTRELRAYRLVNAKFPPSSVFDDEAHADEFEALYALQALTNPRLQNEAGNFNWIPTEEIPFGIPGCSYAVAPFTHVNLDGSRFSDGSFGVLSLERQHRLGQPGVTDLTNPQESYCKKSAC